MWGLRAQIDDLHDALLEIKAECLYIIADPLDDHSANALAERINELANKALEETNGKIETSS